ncbi:hypothetical protein F5Y09DRAFT_336495 [Xylaria sp. FL1042]|nr:hypothetical protein F5Y09DRAFT_336495 [Xylaria sp. FL1042]
MTSICPKDSRDRRIMRRSRFGCRNCKLRKLKCDEGKPRCKRCSSFGLLCNFTSGVPDLQPVADDLVRPSVVQKGAEPQPPLAGNVWTSDTSTFYQLDAKCQDFVTRYLGRSLITPDDPNMVEVNRKLLRLTFTYPFLMHASLAVALAYDRYLNSSLGSPILSFSSPDACTAQESWPLKPSAPSDLEWLRMIKGKMALWRIVNPLRSDSLFRVMAPTFAQMHIPFPVKGIDGVPTDLAIVCHLENSSTAETNPYFNAAHAVSRIQCISDNQVMTGHTQLFTRCIQGPFKYLLMEKDPVALLMLYLWYRKAGRSIWWIELRARVECPSICSYLRLYHKEYGSIHAFLPGGPLADDWS